MSARKMIVIATGAAVTFASACTGRILLGSEDVPDALRGTGGNSGSGIAGGDAGAFSIPGDPSCAETTDAGQCLVVLASGPWRGIAVSSSYLYWTTSPGGSDPYVSGPGPGYVMRVPLGGGASVAVAAGQKTPVSVAATRTGAVYWTNWADFTTSGGSVNMLLPGNSDPVVVATVPQSVGSPGNIAVNGSHVVWTEGAFMAATLEGKNPATFLRLDGGSYPELLAADDANVYWGENGAVTQATLAGTDVSTLASGHGPVTGLAIDATSVYFTANTENLVMKVPIGGGPVTVVASDQAEPTAIAVDSKSIYWTRGKDGADGAEIVRADRMGGRPEVVVGDLMGYGTSPLLVDDTSIYWGSLRSVGCDRQSDEADAEVSHFEDASLRTRSMNFFASMTASKSATAAAFFVDRGTPRA